MASPILCINSISAKGLGLKGVISCCSNNKGVYADVFISGDNKSPKQKTPIDKTGSTNPSWKVPMMFPINVDVPVAQAQQTFVVKLKVVGFLGDKVIGQVHVPMVEVLKGYVDTKGENRMSCCVMIPGGYKGKLDINFEFKELIAYDGADDGLCLFQCQMHIIKPHPHRLHSQRILPSFAVSQPGLELGPESLMLLLGSLLADGNGLIGFNFLMLFLCFAGVEQLWCYVKLVFRNFLCLHCT